MTGEKCFKLTTVEYKIITENNLLSETNQTFTSEETRLFKQKLVHDGFFNDLNQNIVIWEAENNQSLKLDRILELKIEDFRECEISTKDEW